MTKVLIGAGILGLLATLWSEWRRHNATRPKRHSLRDLSLLLGLREVGDGRPFEMAAVGGRHVGGVGGVMAALEAAQVTGHPAVAQEDLHHRGRQPHLCTG